MGSRLADIECSTASLLSKGVSLWRHVFTLASSQLGLAIRSSSKFEQKLVKLEYLAVTFKAAAYLFLREVKIIGSFLVRFHKLEVGMPVKVEDPKGNSRAGYSFFAQFRRKEPALRFLL